MAHSEFSSFHTLERIPPEFRKYTGEPEHGSQKRAESRPQEKNSVSPQDFAFIMLVLTLFYQDWSQ